MVEAEPATPTWKFTQYVLIILWCCSTVANSQVPLVPLSLALIPRAYTDLHTCRCFGDKGDVEDITEGMDVIRTRATVRLRDSFSFASHPS